MNDLLKLAFNGHEIRTVIIDGNPWFVAADVCRALGLEGHASPHLVRLRDDEKRVLKRMEVSNSALETALFGFRQPSTSLISESGLYSLVNRSDKAQARPFQDWVNCEVLAAAPARNGISR